MRVICTSLFLCAALSAQAPAPKPPAPAPAKPKVSAPKPASTAAPKPSAAAAPKPAAAPSGSDKIVLSIGDEKMTAAQFEEFLAGFPPQLQAAAQGPGKRQVVEQLVSMKVLAQEARKRGMDRTPAFRAQLAMQTENLLAGTVYRDIMSNVKVTEEEGRKYYDAHKDEYERVKARHILVRFKGSAVPAGDKKELSEEEALDKVKSIRARISGGEDFASVAKAESDDTGSGANGGDLNFFSRGQMVGPFDQAAFSLPEGQLSEPVKTQFGYHLILVEKHEAKSYEEALPDIEKKLGPELTQKAIEDLRDRTPVTIDDAFFGPAQK
jgi:peptidyl-prolyl cis-trans isomerase C